MNMEKIGKKKYTRNLIIFDYITGSVHIFKVSSDLEINNTYIRNLGFPVSDYMDVTNDDIIKHKGILV